jgi:hypothetical protein
MVDNGDAMICAVRTSETLGFSTAEPSDGVYDDIDILCHKKLLMNQRLFRLGNDGVGVGVGIGV